MQSPANSNTESANDNRLGSWNERALSDLVELIVHRFHQPLRRDLLALLVGARAVETAHRDHPLCPVGLAAHLEQTRLSVESHLEKEEKILFPLVTAGRGGLAFMPVKVMMAEHDDHLVNLRRIAELTRGLALPDGADADWHELYEGLARLDRDLRAHIELENNILFPRLLGGDTGAV